MKLASILKICCFTLAGLTFAACTSVNDSCEPTPPPRFNPKPCLEEIPKTVDGLEIIQGPRTEQNIAADMHPAYCNAQVVLKLMNEEGKPLQDGTVWFKVAVEYTGEVSSVEIIKSEINSREFLKRVSDMIMDSDFTPWRRHDEDVVFIYPMTFTYWWK